MPNDGGLILLVHVCCIQLEWNRFRWIHEGNIN
jgi:hypothetical protein